MLYILFIYHHESGQLLFDKNFQEIAQEKLELFSSFFQTLKAFISEIVITRLQELRNIDLGEYSVSITSINEINADLVIIADKEDNRLIDKIIPKVLRALVDHRELFLNWDGKRESFNILDNPISDIVLSQRKLSGTKTLIEKPISILKSIWARKAELTPEQKNELIQERENLINNMKDFLNVNLKLDNIKKLLEISEKLKDEEGFLKYQEVVRQLNHEMYESKLKLNYYLGRIKDTLHEAVKNLKDKPIREGSFRDVYVNLYSFSIKLKLLTSNNIWQEYQNIANMLIEKEDYSDSELAAGITKILQMQDDLEYYLN